MFAVLIAQSGQQPGGGIGSLLFLPLMIAIFYFFMIRPQRARLRQHQEVLASLTLGDEVETIAGMYGTIRRMEDGVVHVEVAPGLVIKMSRNAIRRKVVEEGAPDGMTG